MTEIVEVKAHRLGRPRHAKECDWCKNLLGPWVWVREEDVYNGILRARAQFYCGGPCLAATAVRIIVLTQRKLNVKQEGR